MRRSIGYGALFLLTAVAMPAGAAETAAKPAVSTTVASVQDGQSFTFTDGRRIRLHGVAAPAPKERCPTATRPSVKAGTWACGAQAQQHLRRLTQGHAVYCDDRGRDRAGRIFAECWAAGIALNRDIVRTGLVKVDRSQTRQFEVDEAEARMAGRGQWEGGKAAAMALALAAR